MCCNYTYLLLLLECSITITFISSSGSERLDLIQCPPELLCTEDEILELLLALDTSKANRPDNISNVEIHCCQYSLCSYQVIKSFNYHLQATKCLENINPLWHLFQKLRTSLIQRTTDLSCCSQSPLKS